MKRNLKKYFWLFLLPITVAFIFAFLVPFCMGVGLSFTDFTTVTDATFVGLQNYITAFSNSGDFLHSLWFTALFTVVSVITVNVLSFLLALMLSRGIRGTNLFRSVFFMPNLIGGIVLGYIWNLLINAVLSNFGVDITYKAEYGFWGLVVLTNWQLIGYMMVIYVAGLQNIPSDLTEAAKIDGASPIQTFFTVVFPMLKPTAITVAILNTMWIWNDYLLPYLVLGSDDKTIPVAIQLAMQGAYGSTDYGGFMAMLVLAIVPIIIFYIFCQKYIIKGVVAGAVKG